MSPPLPVYGGYNVGHGVNAATGKPRVSFSYMPVCLGQVVTQLIADARANALAPNSVVEPKATGPAAMSSPQALVESLPFPFTGFVTTDKQASSVDKKKQTPLAIRYISKARYPIHPYQKLPYVPIEHGKGVRASSSSVSNSSCT
ncbi:hypothetical protein FRB95_012828 [Tulasnella sp. JGI-2019a]|nr:hypothetical protein FRB95_012828 [Tulasnella sp. JGI-2019a]